MDKVKEVLLVAGVVLLVMFPYIWKGQGVQVNVWDNLDSNVVWYKMLKDQNKIFAGPEVMVEGFVTETPRFSYPSGWNVEAVLYFLFEPFTAYWINKSLIVIIAFLGMALLFSVHFYRRTWEILSLALLWATLAYNPHVGISVAGLPLLFWAFINLRDHGKILLSFLSILLYSFYSGFVLVGFFILIFLSVLLIYWRIKDGRFPMIALLGLVLMSTCYIIQEYNLLYFLFLQNDFVSHRQEMDYRYNTFSNHSPLYFIKNGNHNSVFYWWGYIIILVGIYAYLFFKKTIPISAKNIPKKEKELLLFALVCCLLLPFLGSFFSWEGASNLAGKLFPSIHSFNLTRITFPFPFFMFVVLGYGMIYVRVRYKKLLAGILLAINIFVYQFEWRNMLNNRLQILDYQIPSYSQYYAAGQFREIKQFFGENWRDIKVGSINLPPAVSTYHGFKSIDGYLPLYNLEYKKEFKKIIADELEKDAGLQEHFQFWGNKCYLQNAAYPDVFDAYKWKGLDAIETLDYDFQGLQSGFQTHYLFSAVEIHHERLRLMKLFIHEDSAWDIYLYEIK